MPHVLWLLVVAGCSIVLIGCDRSSYATTDLKGEIWVDGIRASKGAITFSPLEPKHGRGVSAPVEDGTYEAKRVAVGPTRITFMLVQETGRMIDSHGKQVPEFVEIVPPKYIAGLDIEVESGESTKDFSLDSK